jgi:hypothetical protein
MRVHLAIIFSLVCGPATADGIPVLSTSVPAKNGPVSIGKPHVCANDYPTAAVQAHAEGMTLLSFTITTGGTVKDIKIKKSSASHWLYKPAEKDSYPVETPWEANVMWKLGEPPSERVARNCLAGQKAPIPVPPTVGMTRLTFRVMADGSIKDIQLAGSSGNRALDDAGVGCAIKGHFDVTLLTVPTEGIPGHVEFDWAQVPPPPPKITPRQRIADPMEKT